MATAALINDVAAVGAFPDALPPAEEDGAAFPAAETTITIANIMARVPEDKSLDKSFVAAVQQVRSGVLPPLRSVV